MPKTPKNALVEASTNVRTGLEFGEQDMALAMHLGVNLAASASVRTEQAVFAYNVATRNLIEAGLLLSSVKAEMTQEEFLVLIEERGLHKVRAYELMRGASFAARLPDHQRDEVLALPKTKVLALASAEPEVVQAMLDDDEVSLDGLSVRDLRQHIKDMEAALADKDVQLETAQAQAEAAKKAAKRERTSAMPLEVEDIRAEIAASSEKARLCLLDLEELMDHTWALMSASDDVAEYSEPTARLALGALLAMHVNIDGLVKAMHSRWHLGDATAKPLSHFTPDEILSAAREFPNLLAVHQHEKALREWERENARPRGKGRPAAKPEAPKKSA